MSKFNYIVFFDAENSIFNFKVKYSFLEYFLLETLPQENYARRCYKKFVHKNSEYEKNGVSEFILNREYFKNFSGMPEKLMQEIGHSWYVKYKLELNDIFFNQKTIFEIGMHKKNNAQIVLLSKIFKPCLDPLIEELSAHVAICPELEIINGYYTGNLISDPINSEGKSRAIKDFLAKQKLAKNEIRFKSDNIESEQLLFCDISYEYKEEINNFFSSTRFKNLYKN